LLPVEIDNPPKRTFLFRCYRKAEPGSNCDAYRVFRADVANTRPSTPPKPSAWGGDDANHVQLANALLGAAQTEAILAAALQISPDARRAATSKTSRRRR
jgi:hypothetical protein